MTASVPDVGRLLTTMADGRTFDPPEELGRLREERPISRVAFPDGHEGWLVTSRVLARAVLADARFSIRADRMHLPIPGAEDGAQVPPAPPGMLTDHDPPEHTRYRRLLTGQFTVRRMRRLTSRIEEFAVQCLDDMERQGPPVDVVQAFAQPLPALMICELLGVPYERRAEFQEHAMTMTGELVSVEQMGTAYAAMHQVLSELVLAKRAEPTDDVLGGLAATSDLTDEELTNVGIALLGAGLDTTANALALGVFALLCAPGQLAALRADPGLADQLVEEVLRYLSIVPFTARAALADVELGGELIRAGDTVAISVAAANRDPEQFTEPDTFDVHGQATGHLAFGHGIHQCLGQQLARAELRVGFPALATRFPTLRLAVPAEQVAFRTSPLIRGLQSLPVAWDA